MVKRLTCLVVGLILALAIGTSALADSTSLNLMYARALDEGYLGVTAGTDYTGDADMSFTAKTENGDLKVINTSVLRNEGTTWFVVLDYNFYDGNNNYPKVMRRALKMLSDSVGDKDEGALVRCDTDRSIDLEQPSVFRISLNKEPKKTRSEELLATVNDVEQYIIANPEKLKPNVAMVIITSCPSSRVSESMIQEIGKTLDTNNTITTHIFVAAMKDGHKQDRDLGQMLIDQAYLTVGGTGYLTEKLSEDEADKGIKRMNDSERRKIMMILDPVTTSVIGKKLSVTQTTSTGTQMTAEAELPDGLVTRWEEALKSRAGSEPEPPQNLSVVDPYPHEDAGSVYRGPVSKADYQPKNEGISTELLIGIIAGVVVLALVAALLIMRAGKNKKAQKATVPIYAGSNSGASSSGGTTITLSGNNGSVLKGQMKGGKLTVGRNGAKAMLTVPSDGKLSGLHATFTKQGSQMMITDNGSTNGTKLNGTKIPAAAPTPVHQNDTITLGSTTYTISWQ